ncbi:MAG: ATP-binding protein [Proteobacteria bacterium]|nr:ATP-binding protein [Pseudomonadota bacterium]
MNTISYPFLKKTGKIINSNQARTVLLTGNIQDLFAFQTQDGWDYLPLVSLLCEHWQVDDRILVVYELNGPIRFIRPQDRDIVKNAWLTWRSGFDANRLAIEKMLRSGSTRDRLDTLEKSFDDTLTKAVGNPTVALELLRQFCLCSRTMKGQTPGMGENLIILIEATDMVIPDGEITRLSDADRHRVCICQDWFSDPGFMASDDAVILFSESRSLINQRVSRLPQVLEVSIDSPDTQARNHFITWFDQMHRGDKTLKLKGSIDEFCDYTAGLSIHALMQLLLGAVHDETPLTSSDVISKVEEYIQSQLGEDIVEFKKPSHTLDDVVGFSDLKEFLKTEVMPRFKSGPSAALPGAAVCGPVGGGKTFIFEAVASELDMIVLVLKNLRSQWFGQTDVILERLRRVLNALSRVLIFVDEADTQFGGIGAETHATERRLTGKIQAMMSDTSLRGRVFWLLMTARIHNLSPDIRRPGRVGDLIIPVLDPEDEDIDAFISWAVSGVLDTELTSEMIARMRLALDHYSAAAFASLRSELKARASMKHSKLTEHDILDVIEEIILPAIGETRRYQTLQALINCTRKSLLPRAFRNKPDRFAWEAELIRLEARGLH